MTTSIMLNGLPVQTEAATLHELKQQFPYQADVVIYNGFQTADDFPLKEGDFVAFIQKGVMPNREELESLMCARHTPAVHQKVKAGRVAIAGLGGLGSNVAVMLARTGVGHLFLVDFDVVEPSNLNRQSYYVSHLGMEKTAAMAQQILQINPFLDVKTKTVRVTEQNAATLFRGYDVVCEAFDQPENKAMLVNALLEHCPETAVVSGSGMAGYWSANDIQTVRKFKRFYVCGDQQNEAQIGNGLMAPRVTVCAAHQANMIVRLLLGIEKE